MITVVLARVLHSNMKRLRWIGCMTLLLCALCAQGQVSRQFWFAPPWMNSHHTGEADFHLILSAYDEDAHVVISQPADGNRVLCDTVVMAHSYCDVIIARWEKLTGRKAVRVDGE